MNIDGLVGKFRDIVASHCLAPGQYARWLWQDAAHGRELGINEYGCADAANILYTIGDFPRDAAAREAWIQALQGLQEPESGLYRERTHHPIHTTAHCLAALELFDALPAHPPRALEIYLDRDALYEKLESLDWLRAPWPQSHQGAGLFAALTIARMASAAWQDWYFDWLREHADPDCGISYRGRVEVGAAPLFEHMCGWFHYLFNHAYARRPFPYPERLIDSCLSMYENAALGPGFGKMVGFKEIDWVFCVNRACRQVPHRFHECRAALRAFAASYCAYLDGLDPQADEGLNDLHMLFGALCALAELQMALPGELTTTVPLKLVLDRRPFI